MYFMNSKIVHFLKIVIIIKWDRYTHYGLLFICVYQVDKFTQGRRAINWTYKIGKEQTILFGSIKIRKKSIRTNEKKFRKDRCTINTHVALHQQLLNKKLVQKNPIYRSHNTHRQLWMNLKQQQQNKNMEEISVKKWKQKFVLQGAVIKPLMGIRHLWWKT